MIMTRLPQQRLFPWILTLLLSTQLSGCFWQEEAHANASDSANSRPPLPVNVLTMQSSKVPIQTEVIGNIEGKREIEVFARANGLIEQQLYQEGQPIKAGAPMFQLEREPYEIPLAQAKANLAQQSVQAEQAQNEEKRLSKLLKQNAISQREYDTAHYAAKLAQANILAAKAKVREAELNLSYTRVTAPVSGIAGRALQSVGSYMQTGANTPLTSIVQLDPIWVRFSLSEQDFARIKDETNTRVELMLDDGQQYPHPGTLNFTAAALDGRLGTLELRAEFTNPKQQLLPGKFVRVRLTTAQQRDAMLVPQSAVMQSEQGHFVYVISDDKATIRPIETGAWVGQQWTVLSGLQNGDQVIIDNLLKLRPGAPVQAISTAATQDNTAKEAP